MAISALAETPVGVIPLVGFAAASLAEDTFINVTWRHYEILFVVGGFLKIVLGRHGNLTETRYLVLKNAR